MSAQKIALFVLVNLIYSVIVASANNPIISGPSVTTLYETEEFHGVYIVAYDAERNPAEGIRPCSTRSYYSDGSAALLRYDDGTLLHFDPQNQRIKAQVTFLTPPMRVALAEAATKSLPCPEGSRITHDQVIQIPFQNLTATITFTEDKKWYVLHGKAVNTQSTVIPLTFSATKQEMQLLHLKSEEDWVMTVDYSFTGNVITKQVEAATTVGYGVVDKLYDELNGAQEKALTREQTADFETKLRRGVSTKLIQHDPTVPIPESFLDYFSLVGRFTQYFPFTTQSIADLQSKGLPVSPDLQPDVLTKAAKKHFQQTKIHGVDHVAIDVSGFNFLKEVTKRSSGGGGSFSFLGIGIGGGGYDYGDKDVTKQTQYVRSDVFLKEINRLAISDLVWEQEGTMIIPKSIAAVVVKRQELNAFTSSEISRAISSSITIVKTKEMTLNDALSKIPPTSQPTPPPKRYEVHTATGKTDAPLNSNNQWHDLPDLKIKTSVSSDALLIVHYDVATTNNNGFFCSKLEILNAEGQVVVDSARQIAGHAVYVGNSDLWIGSLPSGEYTFKVVYRADNAVAALGSGDWNGRSISLVVFQ